MSGRGDLMVDRSEPEGHIERVPEEVRAAARRAFSVRDPLADLADLVHDSAVDDVPVPADGRDSERVLRFSSRDHDIDVVVRQASHATVELDVHVVPDGVRLTEVGGTESPTVIVPTGVGRCTVRVTRGLLSLVLDGEGRRVRTAWVRL